METALPQALLNNKSGKMYENFIKSYSGDMEPADFAAHVCSRMTEAKNYSGGKDIVDLEQSKKSLSGRIFELMVAEILKHHNITPFYMQAQMWQIPNSKFDFLCFNERQPVILSTKISIAERWRQSAFEGFFLKQIYRNAKCYLITNEEEHKLVKRNKDIEDNKISGIDRFCYVQSSEMNDLIDELKSLKFKKSKPVDPVSDKPEPVIIE